MLSMYILLFLINFVVCKSCSVFYADRCENCTQSECVECKVGFWNVTLYCSNTCVTPTCTCTDYSDCLSCKDGYYGIENNCDRNCPSRCNGQPCNNDGACLCKPNFTGNSCDSCVDGKFGANCSMQCSRGCKGNNCSPTDGSCTCKEYYSGEQCENCIADRYGEDCSKPCSLGCLLNTCAFNDGKCDCREFYKGARCEVCVNGRYGDGCLNACRYGEYCLKPCSLGCLENCSHIDGKCDCREFYTGDTCDVCVDWRYGDGCLNASEQNHSDVTDNFRTGALTGGVFGAVVVLVATVAITVLVKRRLSQKEAKDYENKQETTTPGGNVTQPGPYETLNTGRIEKNDRKDTYTSLFTTGQVEMTKGASPNKSTVGLLNVVGGEKDKSGPYEILNATMSKENERSDTYNSLFTTGQAGGADNDNSEIISMDHLTIGLESHSYANTMLRK